VKGRAGERLSVFLHDEQIGELERRGPARYRFQYSEATRAENTAGDVILSASLPLQEQAFMPSEAAPFFEGLLPEGAIRAAIANSLHRSEEDGFGLLAALGAECAGAVSILSPGARPPGPGSGRLRPLTSGELLRLIEELPRRPLGVDSSADGVRLSLGGIQHKLVLVNRAYDFLQPLDGAASNCLLKPEFGQYEDLVFNERFCMMVAAGLGLRVANTDLITVGDIPCLYVRRFDRYEDGDGRTRRIHQEDLCQALGMLPSAKYEENGGPSILQVVELLRVLRGPFMARDINDFIQAVMVNFLLGNSDAHGKNFALLYEPGVGVRLAPQYDIVSTAAYSGVTDRMAMAIGGLDDPRDVDIDAWMRLAEECGFGGGIVSLLRRRAAALLRVVERLREIAEDEGWHRPVIDAIADLCRVRIAAVT
jgi:serine/threonine-protein kinase HipA